MFEPIPNAAKSKLWKHQSKALGFMVKHLSELDSPCLVRMPTGTGKTGLIACLTRLSNQESSLVLTPWAHLRNQMISDLDKAFWEKTEIVPGEAAVVAMYPSNVEDVLKQDGKKVIVATFATLNSLRRDHPDSYKKLAETISLVLVDEGHYEPAVEWGKSVKGLNTKTVLLTATPYRNDLKLFRITDSKRSAHHFTHKEAVEKGIIRELQCEELDSDTEISNLAVAFAKTWNAAKSGKRLPSTQPRAIICCATDEDIETAVTHLRDAELGAIGIHEQFEDYDDEHLLKAVPDPRQEEAEIWVHQNKLTEGLDDSRFCCVALFTRIRNDRKLIQQIGRVLRKTDDDRKQPSRLLAPPGFSAEAEWKAYLEFETELQLLEPQHFRDVVDTLLGSQPKVEYFDGRFRRRFNPADLPHRPQVIIPPSVLVRTAGKEFSLKEYVEDCTDTLNTNDAVILGPDINMPCQWTDTFALWVYASVQNSRFLQNTSLYEVKLETHCVVVEGDFVFMTDSGGNFPAEYIDEHTGRVPPTQLSKFLDHTFRPTNVSVDSSIPYDTVIKGADLRGHNLLNIAASLTDRVHICRAARGTSTDSGRRYVGMSNARLRKELNEEQRRNYELETFVSWTGEVAKILNSKVRSSSLFERYMPVCDPPDPVIPRTISLDLVSSELSIHLANGTECSLRSSSSDIVEQAANNATSYRCSFDFEGDGLDGSPLVLRLDYDRTKGRFWFNRHSGPRGQVTEQDDGGARTKSFSDFLNHNQDRVLIGIDGGGVVYQGRNFYEIDHSFAEHTLLGLISQLGNGPSCSSEKGTSDQINAVREAKTASFPDTSLFRAIEDRRIDLPFDDELLICDDMGTECADFIAANFQQKQLAFIHAKAGPGAGVSASSFHDVVAQAIKNLVYLTRNDDVLQDLIRGVGRQSGTTRVFQGSSEGRKAVPKKLTSGEG